MTCPNEPIPAGWKVWRGPVPTELAQFAMAVRDHVRRYARGTIAETVSYNGALVGAFVSSHTWTFRGGQLVTGLCIPGVSLVQQVPAGVGVTDPVDLSQPDPDLAMYGADAPEFLGWLAAGVVAGFVIEWAMGRLTRRGRR